MDELTPQNIVNDIYQRDIILSIIVKLDIILRSISNRPHFIEKESFI